MYTITTTITITHTLTQNDWTLEHDLSLNYPNGFVGASHTYIQRQLPIS
jgi:hypothetical protein